MPNDDRNNAAEANDGEDDEVLLRRLDALVGEWRMEVDLPGPSSEGVALATFEWGPGRRLLVERWQVPVPEAPDGVAIIDVDRARPGVFLQHYFDSRGVMRLYKMRFDGETWELRRDEPDFSPLHFHQRFVARRAGADTFAGAWEISHDAGVTWERDFALSYVRQL